MAIAPEEIVGERFWSDPETGRFATLGHVGGGTDFVQVLIWRPSMVVPGKFEIAGAYAMPSPILTSLSMHLIKKAGELVKSEQSQLVPTK
jgi:hypothetical protein